MQFSSNKNGKLKSIIIQVQFATERTLSKTSESIEFPADIYGNSCTTLRYSAVYNKILRDCRPPSWVQ